MVNIPESPEVVAQKNRVDNEARVERFLNLWLVVVDSQDEDLMDKLNELITDILQSEPRVRMCARMLSDRVVKPILEVELPEGVTSRTVEFEFDHDPELFEMVAKDYLNARLAWDFDAADDVFTTLLQEDDESEVIAFFMLLTNLFWAST